MLIMIDVTAAAPAGPVRGAESRLTQAYASATRNAGSSVTMISRRGAAAGPRRPLRHGASGPQPGLRSVSDSDSLADAAN